MQIIQAPGEPGYHRRRIFNFLTKHEITEVFSSTEVEADTYADARRAAIAALAPGRKVAGLIGIRHLPAQRDLDWIMTHG